MLTLFAFVSLSDKRKTRFLAQVVTPALPNYLHGRLESSSSDAAMQPTSECQELFHVAPPLVCVSSSVSGTTLLQAYLDERKLVVREGLAPDAVEVLLRAGGVAKAFLHRSDDTVVIFR
jgi:hypothetical protein